MGRLFCKHPLQRFLPLHFKHSVLAAIPGRITNQTNDCVQEILCSDVLGRQQQMPILISLDFPSFSQIVICCFCWSTNCFANGIDLLHPSNFFIHFQHFKPNLNRCWQCLASLKAADWCMGLIFWERAKAKDRAEAAFAIARLPRTKRVQQRSIDVYREKSENWG